VQDPATTSLGSTAVLAGGLDSADVSVSDVLIAGSGGVHTAPSLPVATHDAAAAAIGNQAYFFGGGEPSKDAIIAIGGATSQAGTLPAAASDVAAATIGDTTYIVGGYTGTVPLDTIVAWKGSGTGTVAGHLPAPVRYAAVTAIGGKLIIAGGSVNSSASPDVYSFDPATATVTKVAQLPDGITHAGAAALGNYVFVVGGRGSLLGTQTNRVLAIDPATGAVTEVGHLPVGTSDAGVATVSGQILVAGGRHADGTVTDRIYMLTPRAAAASDPSGARSNRRRRSRRTAYREPKVLDRNNVYAADTPGNFAAAAATARPLIYVPNSASNTVDEIDPRTSQVVRQFSTGSLPQHIVPAYDLKTLYVTNDIGNSLTPIDPQTGAPGTPIPVEDPYNMYNTPDGQYAVVMAERMRLINFLNPQTLQLVHSLAVPQCAGVNHADYTADGRYMLASCEFGAAMIVVDIPHERVVKRISLPGSSPQDVKLSPDGKVFYVADLTHGGVYVIDASTLTEVGFIATGAGAHGLYPSRDARDLYISNRAAGTISVLDFSTRKLIHTWHIPGSSPDMGGVSSDGRVLWLSGRYSQAVYAISTVDGKLLQDIPVGYGPHGLLVWPQPGRYSLGHTGIMR
jgi:DNA-binding beta-propeller fold protein YncE